MTLEAHKLERLIFVKFLLSQAEKQKDYPHPKDSVAILSLHDLVECFLQVALEHLTNRNKLTSQNILDSYAEELNKVLSDKQQTIVNKAYIKRLNELRNSLKHSSVFVNPKNIHNLYAETETFIIDFTQIFFEVDFQNISMLGLIDNITIRDLLIEGEKLIEEANYVSAILNISKAFYELKVLVTRIPGKRGVNLIDRTKSRTDYTRYVSSIFGGDPLPSNLSAIFKEVATDVDEIKSTILELMDIQAFSTDIRKYLKFKDITPRISKYFRADQDVQYYIPEEKTLTNDKYSLEQVRFCFDFVVDTTFDYQSRL